MSQENLQKSKTPLQPDHDSPQVSSSEDLGFCYNSGKSKRKLEEIKKIGNDGLIPTGPGGDNKNRKTYSEVHYPKRMHKTYSEVHYPKRMHKNLIVASSVEENDVPTPKTYTCGFSSKTFSNYRSLGGRVRSGHMLKIYDKNGSVIKDNQQTESVGDDRTYSCKICFKKFSSPRTLEGHRRHHRTGNVQDRNTQSACKILDFDLNELPSEEDEDPSTSRC